MARPRPVPPYCRAVEEIRLSEFLEKLSLLFRGHADAGIGYRELYPVALIGKLSRKKRYFALLGEFASIAQEIEQDLPNPSWGRQ